MGLFTKTEVRIKTSGTFSGQDNKILLPSHWDLVLGKPLSSISTLQDNGGDDLISNQVLYDLMGTGSGKIAWGNHSHSEYAAEGHNHDDRYYTEGEADSRFVKRIDLSSQVQVTSYRKSVIALCELTNTNPSNNSYSIGKLTFHRDNGLQAPVELNIAIEKRYNAEGANIVSQSMGGNSFADNFQFIKFQYGGVWYGGIEFYFTAAQHGYVAFFGETNFNIFGLDYYETQNDTILNTEVYNSITNTDIVLETDFFFNNNAIYHTNNKPSLTDLGTIADLGGKTSTEITTEINNKMDAHEGANNPHGITITSLGGKSASAITNEINAAIDALIGGAPGALDTLNELAAALDDDADFHTAVTNALALKAPLASPTFTGIVTIPNLRGNTQVYGTDITGGYSGAPIEIREVNLVTTNQSSSSYAPALSFHWGGRKQAQIKLYSDGYLHLEGNHTGRVVTMDTLPSLSELTQDSTHRTVTDTEKSTWNGKVDNADLETWWGTKVYMSGSTMIINV